MYRGDKEEGPEQIPGVHHVPKSAVLIYSHWPVQIASATSGRTQTFIELQLLLFIHYFCPRITAAVPDLETLHPLEFVHCTRFEKIILNSGHIHP